MATEYTCITRKIEVHLHRHGDSEEAKQRYQDEKQKWYAINDNLYKAANRIISHCFFNDAYEYRLKIHSPRFNEIEKLLKYSKRNKLSEDDIKSLKAERKVLFDSFKKQRQAFLRGGATEGSNPEPKSTYQVVSDEFGDIIPSKILSCLNRDVSKMYSTYKKDVESGTRSISNFKEGMPIPFPMDTGSGNIALRQRSDGSLYILTPGKREWKSILEWDLEFGKDKSNNREIVERILNGMYTPCDSSIQRINKGRKEKNKVNGKNEQKEKFFLLLVVQIPKKTKTLNKDRVVGIDLGVNIPLYAALNDNELAKVSIGSRDQFHNVRRRMNAQRRDLYQSLRHSTNGGHGRKQKLQALERFKGKERNWVHLQNHIYSKQAIQFALDHEAGVIQMERLTGYGKDQNNQIKEEAKFLGRYWSYFELQTMIEYKANAAGIEVRYIDPYHTSQMCSFCGHYEKGQRINQSTFICKNPDCLENKGRGKQNKDGTYQGINADWNAARNIAKSTQYVDKKKK